jgi:hypothetical protein
MAKRYSGSLKITVTYDDHNFYRTSVSQGDKLLWKGTVRPAPAGFGPGVAYDSPQAYDEVASSALAFADNEIRGIGDEAEFKEDLTGYLIRRSPRSKGTSQHSTKRGHGRSVLHHATRERSHAQLEDDIHKALILSLKPGAKIKANGYPGNVVRVTSYGMVEVRLPGGVATVSPEDVQLR